MSDDQRPDGLPFGEGLGRPSRQLLAELEGTQVYLRVAAAESLSYASMLRMERHAERRCAQLLARLDRTLRQDDSTDELLAGDARGADLAFVRQTTATQVFAAAEGGRYEPFDEGPEGAADELVDLKSEELISADGPDLVSMPASEGRKDAVEDEDTSELIKHAARLRASEAAAASTARSEASAASEPTYVSYDPTPVPAEEDDGLEELELDEVPEDENKESFDLAPDDTEPTFVARRGPPPPAAMREAMPSFPPPESATSAARTAAARTPLTEVPRADTRPTRPPPAAVPPPPPAASTRASISVVPTIRDADAPARPRAAAIQINAGGSGGKVLGLEEEEEPIEIGAAEDDDQAGEVDLAEGFSVTLQTSQELELESEEEEEEEEEEEDAVEELPASAPAKPSAEEIAAILAKARQSATEGRLQLGAELFSDVIDADPDNVDAHVARGRLYLDLGDYSRAMSDFMVAEDIAPNSPEPQVAIGDLYFARKDYRKAIDYFNAALEVAPNHAMAFCRRGISHYYRKNFKEAVDDLLRAEKLDADIPNIQTYVAMAKKKVPKK